MRGRGDANVAGSVAARINGRRSALARAFGVAPLLSTPRVIFVETED